MTNQIDCAPGSQPGSEPLIVRLAIAYAVVVVLGLGMLARW